MKWDDAIAMPTPNQKFEFQELRRFLHTSEPAELGPTARSGTLPHEPIEEAIRAVVGETILAERTGELIRGTLLLWHDHLDAAHAIAQSIENADGSLLHAIMHRREPDYWNSKYWFQHAGKHICYSAIAARAGALLEHDREKRFTALVLNGNWDPFAFVDACEELERGGRGGTQKDILRKIQKIEFEAFLDHVLQQALEP
ncbi:MAG: hypothetical protein HY735_18760 [Verrucomicrobia bacterium]|nr:hypothetical protein [Verrucomicrobiota bacterium]